MTSSIDWISSVVVPVAAILISAGIAIALAAHERRAAERARIRDSAAELLRRLSQFGRALHRGKSDAEADAYLDDVMASTNALAALVPARDVDVLKFSTTIVVRAVHLEDRKAAGSVIGWLTTCLELWARGAIKSRDFSKHMPPTDHGLWQTTADLDEWRRFFGDQSEN